MNITTMATLGHRIPTTRHAAPSTLESQAESSPALSARHAAELDASALSQAVRKQRGYLTITDPRALPAEFAPYQHRAGLLIPIRDVTGTVASYQLKADNPRVKDGKEIKYETAANVAQCIDVPASVRPLLRNPAEPLWITEGAKKVDSGLSHGIRCIVGLQGVYGWRGTNENGGTTALPDWEDVALNGRHVLIAFDSDVMTKESVRDALQRLSAFLRRRKAQVHYLLLPHLPDGSKCGLDDFFAAGHTAEELQQYVRDELPPSDPEWDVPIPLETDTGPPLSDDVLPGQLGAYAAAVAEETQASIGLVLPVILGSLSAAAGNRYTIQGSESWREPVHLMMLGVAEPASRKSQVFQLITRPIVDYENQRRQDDRRALAEWQSRENVLNTALSSAEKALTKPDADSAVIGKAEAVRMSAVQELEDHREKRPRITTIILDDVTVEKAKSALSEQGGSVAVMSPESTFLDIVAGRYGKTPNLDVILNGHAGDRIRVDRRGIEGPEIVERACLTLCLMAQPSVIRKLGQIPQFMDRGPAARLLPVFPETTVGKRKIAATAVPDARSYWWASTLQAILQQSQNTESTGAEPIGLTLDREAQRLFDAFCAELEPHLGAAGPFAEIARFNDWAGKLAGTVLRIAALLHLVGSAGGPEDKIVTNDTIRRALQLGQYFTEHAKIMYRMMNGQSRRDASIVLDAIRALTAKEVARSGERVITRRALRRRLRSQPQLDDESALNNALRVLEDHEWIRYRTKDGADTGGRPSSEILLTPCAETLDKSAKTHRVDSFGTFVQTSPLATAEDVIASNLPTSQGQSTSGTPFTGQQEWSIEL
jgi:hypothetical protein